MLTGSSPMPVKGRLFPGPGSGYARVTLSFLSRALLPWRENCPPLGLALSLAAGFPHSSAFTRWPQGRGEQLRGRVLLPPTTCSSPSPWAALASLEAPPLWRGLSHMDCLELSAALWAWLGRSLLALLRTLAQGRGVGRG